VGGAPLPTLSHCTGCKTLFQESPRRRATRTCARPGGQPTRIANVYNSSRSC